MSSDVWHVQAFAGDWNDPAPTIDEVKAAIKEEGLDESLVEAVDEFGAYLIPFTEEQAKEFEEKGEIEFKKSGITFYAEDY